MTASQIIATPALARVIADAQRHGPVQRAANRLAEATEQTGDAFDGARGPLAIELDRLDELLAIAADDHPTPIIRTPAGDLRALVIEVILEDATNIVHVAREAAPGPDMRRNVRVLSELLPLLEQLDGTADEMLDPAATADTVGAR